MSSVSYCVANSRVADLTLVGCFPQMRKLLATAAVCCVPVSSSKAATNDGQLGRSKQALAPGLKAPIQWRNC